MKINGLASLVDWKNTSLDNITAVVSQSPDALQWVPEIMRTEDVCRAAVAQNGNAIQWVPVDLRDAVSRRVKGGGK